MEEPLPSSEDFGADQIVGWILVLLGALLVWVGFIFSMTVQGQLIAAKQNPTLAWLLVPVFWAFAALEIYAGWKMREGERRAFFLGLIVAVPSLAGGIPGVVTALLLVTYCVARLSGKLGPEPW